MSTDLRPLLDDHEVEARLRATYASMARRTTVAARPMPERAPRTARALRPALALAAVLLVVGLSAAVTRRDGPAATAPDAGRVAVTMLPLGWRLLEQRPYAAGDRLGPNSGEVLRYGRGRATLDVITLRWQVPDVEGLLEATPIAGRPAFATADGRLVVRAMEDDLIAVLRLTGPAADAGIGSAELREMAEALATLSPAAWARAQQRQGFAVVRDGRPDAPAVFGLGDGLEVERSVSGTLRGGFMVCWRAVVDGTASIGITCGTPTSGARPSVAFERIGDDRFVVSTFGPVVAVELDGSPVALEPVIDPDSGGTVTFRAVTLDPDRSHRAVAFDDRGDVVFTANWTPPDGVNP